MPKRTEYDTTKRFKDNETPLKKAEEMRHCLEEEYTLTTEAICDLLQCNRKYIDDYIKPNVANVFIHAKQMSWIASILNLDPSFVNEHRSYYYFKKDSFMRYLQRVMICTRQTIRLDLMDYMKKGTSSELVLKHIKNKEFEQAIEYLNPMGRRFYSYALLSSTERKLTSAIKVENPIQFEDLPLLRASSSRNNERFYRQAFVDGYIKVKLNGKSYFINPSKELVFAKWGITLSYEDYCRILCYEK